ncbi:MAG: helix-turn-helix transcriptional regulator [Planctomycetes bacterium]|nr:helix-turn-helix transcriptional regulator [Planctomycetota bacterium]
MTRSIFSERYRSLCRLLVETRKSRRLTQAEVAKRLQRPQSFVSKYEIGERRLDVVEFLEVAEALDTDAQRLISKFYRQ